MKAGDFLKKQSAVLLIFSIIFALFIFLIFILSDERDNTFWITFAFSALSILLAGTTTLLSINSDKYSFPIEISIITFSYLYVAFVAVVDLVFGWVFRVEENVYLSIHIVVLAAFFVIEILMVVAKNAVSNQNKTANAKVYEQQILMSEIERLKYMAARLPLPVRADTEVMLNSLSEFLRFSELAANATVSDLDNKIRSKTFALACELDNLIEIQSDDVTALESAIAEIKQLVSQRSLQIRNEKIGI